MLLNKYLTVLLAGILLGGCANNEIYYWGEYESIVRQSYVEPGVMNAQTQIERLNTDLQKAESSGKKIAPGIYAHLGTLYAAQGKYTQSRAALLQEKTLFPEASVLIDGMLSRVDKKQAN
ncbi:Probable lipoprotein [hydrothermal vent metagenome]|uniref:Probable lipoprotein n=1 Tax=hydrothermal vent metagenome TaxID=652676 RepID=A0A1W1DYG4_9ZZZZ